jgi:hypothetical protein
MANPTTNYGWPMPTSTDLVTDLPADFAAFGQPVDTSLKALNPETTLGDIAYRSATANTNTRLGIGSTGNVLTVSGGVPSWAAPAAGGSMTLLASGNMSSTGVTISSISGSYKNLVGWIKNPYVNTGDDLAIRVNGDTASRYNYVIDNTTATIRQAAMIDHIRFVASTNLPTTSVGVFASFVIHDYANTSHVKNVTTTYADPSNTISAMGSGQYNQTTAITSVFIGTDGGTSTFSGGTYEIYGVN